MLVVAFNVAVGVMVFQLACDLFSLGIQTFLLRRRPLPPVDNAWLNRVVGDLPMREAPARARVVGSFDHPDQTATTNQ